MTAPRFDPVVHAPNRLQICAMLAAVESAEFAAVRDELDVSDSVLSKHVKVLEDAGYVHVKKATVTSRQRTWLALTRAGRRALDGHVAELHRLLSLSSGTGLDLAAPGGLTEPGAARRSVAQRRGTAGARAGAEHPSAPAEREAAPRLRNGRA